MEITTKREHARLSMRIMRAVQKGKSEEYINQLLAEREALKMRAGKYNTKYNIITSKITTYNKPKPTTQTKQISLKNLTDILTSNHLELIS